MASKPEERPHKKLRLVGSLQQTVTLVVGEGDEEQSFAVHQNILCNASPFFKAACKPEWMKPDDRVIKLPEDDPTAIQAMIYWMYHNGICVPPVVTCYTDQGNFEKDGMKNAEGLFVQLYVLGQKYQILKLRNDSIDAFLYLRGDRNIQFGIVPYAYRNTLDGSPLRGVLVKIARFELKAGEFDDLKGTLCSEFLHDIAKLYLGDRDIDEGLRHPEDPEEKFCKNFHIHDSGSKRECQSLKKFKYAFEEDI